MLKLSFRNLVMFTCATALGVALAPSPAQAEETEPHLLGAGYKIGNGLGFLGGDVIVRAVPHVALDLQANVLSVSGTNSASGFGLAPTLQFQWSPVGHTPYVAVGYLYASLSSGDVSASASGLLLNAGYEWRFASGVGILLGGGAAYLGDIHATNGVDTVSRAGGWHFNIEAGLRYYFLRG